MNGRYMLDRRRAEDLAHTASEIPPALKMVADALQTTQTPLWRSVVMPAAWLAFGWLLAWSLGASPLEAVRLAGLPFLVPAALVVVARVAQAVLMSQVTTVIGGANRSVAALARVLSDRAPSDAEGEAPR